MPELMETEIPSNLKLFEFIADHNCELTLSDIADGLGLVKSTLRRLLHLLD